MVGELSSGSQRLYRTTTAVVYGLCRTAKLYVVYDSYR